MSSSQRVPCQSLQFSLFQLHFQTLFYLNDIHCIHIKKDKKCSTFVNHIKKKMIISLPLMTEISKSGWMKCPSEKVDCKILFLSRVVSASRRPVAV